MDNSLLAVRDINHKYIVVDRSSKNFPCKELQNIFTGRKKLMIVKKVGAVNRGALRNPHRNTAKVRGHLL